MNRKDRKGREEKTWV